MTGPGLQQRTETGQPRKAVVVGQRVGDGLGVVAGHGPIEGSGVAFIDAVRARTVVIDRRPQSPVWADQEHSCGTREDLVDHAAQMCDGPRRRLTAPVDHAFDCIRRPRL